VTRMFRRGLVWAAMAAVVVPLTLVPASAGAATNPVRNTADNASAGYVSVLAGQTEVQASFVVPKVTCTASPQYFAISLQLEAKNGSTDEFMSSDAEGACSAAGQKATWSTYACAGETCSETTKVAPGNTVTVTDSFTARKTTATLLDVTTGAHEKAGGPGATSATNSNFIVQRADATVPTFKRVVWSNCTVNGEALGSADAFKENMTNADDQTQVATGSVQGSGFTTTFKHS
jgi:hypothetical protein